MLMLGFGTTGLCLAFVLVIPTVTASYDRFAWTSMAIAWHLALMKRASS